MTDIEIKIREQKNKIKEDQRELARLQDEAKTNENDFVVSFNSLLEDDKSRTVNFDFTLSKRYYPKSEDVVRKLGEILMPFAENKDEPKSYVNWDKIDKKYNWVAFDEDGELWGYRKEPSIENGSIWNYVGSWYDFNKLDDNSVCVINAIRPFWSNSLIHRPGIKE